MSSIQAKVVSIDSLTSTVTKVVLSVDKPLEYKAGQYLQVVMGENDKRPFSIANAPNTDRLIELHIGATPENPYAYEVLSLAKNEQSLLVEIGLGDAYVRKVDTPMLIIAGGTGYSYAKSILLDTLATQVTRPITLYWGAKTIADLYEAEYLEQLSLLHPQFKFYPVVENPTAQWTGHTGLVHQAALDDNADLEAVQVYAAGRFEMAAVIKNTFGAAGLPSDALFGDAFAYL